MISDYSTSARGEKLRFVFLGLSITSSWGNGHATTYRGLTRELTKRGHEVSFLERDVPWYSANRDLPGTPYARIHLYKSLEELRDRFTTLVRDASAVIVGSYVPEGVAVSEWVTDTAHGVTAFYDIDTPITLRKLECGDYEYLSPDVIPKFSLYLSFTGGPVLRRIRRQYGAGRTATLYCSADPELYYPETIEKRWDMGFLGTYGADRQPALDELFIKPAMALRFGRFVAAGPLYPDTIVWPPNVQRIEHLPPASHRNFYNSQRFALNVTRADMVQAGFSPSVRLFEAASCAVPIISDDWRGLHSIFRIGSEILVARNSAEILHHLKTVPEEEQIRIGERARARVLRQHTPAHRAAEVERQVREILGTQTSRATTVSLYTRRDAICTTPEA